MDTNNKAELAEYIKISQKLYECANETKDLLNNRPKIKILTYDDYLQSIPPSITVSSPTTTPSASSSLFPTSTNSHKPTPEEIDQFLAEMKDIDKQIDEWYCEYSDNTAIPTNISSSRRNSKILKDSTRLNETKINIDKTIVQPTPPPPQPQLPQLNQQLIDEINNKEFNCENLLNVKLLIEQDSKIFDSLFQHTDILYDFIEQIYGLIPTRVKTEAAATTTATGTESFAGGLTEDEKEFEKLLDKLVMLLGDIHSLSQEANVDEFINNEESSAGATSSSSSLFGQRDVLSDILQQLYKKSLSLDENKKK